MPSLRINKKRFCNLLKIKNKHKYCFNVYKIENAVFEYEPDHEEGTNFDFYLTLDDGKRISFECK